MTKKYIAEMILDLSNSEEHKDFKELYMPIIDKVYAMLKSIIEEKGLHNSEDRSFAMILLAGLSNLSKISEIMQYKESLLF
mmetsp:Transcript_2662/g.2493  ORF Transcript_2662/g.2493 Transcript_2662/m.2493 type:complete len:81 (-) Transcript_2662:38-280(-)